MTTSLSLTARPRRNRKMEAVRSLVRETRLHPGDFVAPLFVLEGEETQQPIASMPGVCRLSIDLLLREVEVLYDLGIRAVDLFPVISDEQKNSTGTASLDPDNLVFRTVRALKDAYPDLCVMVDIALDPFTDHGHDGLVDDFGCIINDSTVDLLAKMSVIAAEAGADVVAPSDMMDGRVAAIRAALDSEGHHGVSICSYAAKYASAFYGPFREALHSAPRFGDKKTYQMDPANRREALLEAALDEAEGADMLLVKPGLPYLDVIAALRERTDLPIGAYHVSGEYAMVMAAAERGWIDADRVLMESLISIKRAGSDFIFTYAARRIAELL